MALIRYEIIIIYAHITWLLTVNKIAGSKFPVSAVFARGGRDGMYLKILLFLLILCKPGRFWLYNLTLHTITMCIFHTC